MQDEGREVRVNAVCPGFVDTDASGPWFVDMSGAQSSADASRDVLWLALAGSDVRFEPGALYQHRRIVPWR